LLLANPNEQPRSLMRRSGFDLRLGAGHIVGSVDEAVGLCAAAPPPGAAAAQLPP
jgi:hypothetical protein